MCFPDTDANNCGPTCTHCPDVTNAVKTCVANRCSSQCAAGITPITCPAGGGTSSCGAWAFDSGTLERWTINPDFTEPSVATGTDLTVTTARRVDATSTFALVTNVRADPDLNEVVLEIGLCAPPNSSNFFTTIPIRGILEVNAFFERTTGTPLTGDPALARVSGGTFDANLVGGTGGPLFATGVVEGRWLNGRVTLNGSGTHIQLSFFFAQPWVGRLYLDSLRLLTQ